MFFAADLSGILALNVRLLNVSIRALILLSRFVFMFALARLLEPSQVGQYGLLVAAVGYSIYFVGLDFYNYTSRQVAGGDRSLWGLYIKSQLALSVFLWCVFFPLFLIVFAAAWLPWSLVGWFFLILVFEYACLEMIRFFIAASEQLYASLVLFFNQACWAVVVVLLMALSERFRGLDWVLSFWVGGSLIALALACSKLRRMQLGGWSSRIDWSWIWGGVKVAVPMLVATLALRGIFTFDRYLVGEVLGLDKVAVYVLFIGVAGTLLAFLDAAVFSFAYPGLIEAFKRQQAGVFRKNMRMMLVSVVAFSMIFTACSFLVLPYLLFWVGKEVYLEGYYVFYWVLLAIVINALWMVFHYALYSQSCDGHIIGSRLLAFLVFLLASYVFYFSYPRDSIFIGLCLSQLVMLVWNFLAYRAATPKEFLGFGWN